MRPGSSSLRPPPPPPLSTTHSSSSSPAMKLEEKLELFELTSTSYRNTQMLKNLRLKIKTNVANSEDINTRTIKMNTASMNLRRVRSKLEQKNHHDINSRSTTTTFRRKIISKLVETEFEAETKTIILNAWKIAVEKEKEKRDVINKKLEAIRIVTLRRKFDHWRDVSKSLKPRREALEVLEFNAKSRALKDSFHRWRKFARLSQKAMHVAAMKTIDYDKKILTIAFARWELALAKQARSKVAEKLISTLSMKKAFIAWRTIRNVAAFKVEVARRKLRGDSEHDIDKMILAWKTKTERDRMSLYFRVKGSTASIKVERIKGQYDATKDYVETLLPLAQLDAPWDSYQIKTCDNDDDDDKNENGITTKKRNNLIVEETKVEILLREAKEAIRIAAELREECEFARNVAEDAERASDFLLAMFQRGKDVSQTHLSNALIHAENMYGKFTLLSAQCEKASADAVKSVRLVKEAEKSVKRIEEKRLFVSTSNNNNTNKASKEISMITAKTKNELSSREIAIVFANRNCAKRFLKKWQSANEVLQRDRVERFFTTWQEETRKQLIQRAEREICIENFIDRRTVTVKAKVFAALYWHAHWRKNREKVLINAVKPIANSTISQTLKVWKAFVYNKKLLFRVFANCERAWEQKRNEPYDFDNIQTKREVLQAWLENAREVRRIRNTYSKAIRFNEVSLKLNYFQKWRTRAELGARRSAEQEKKLLRDTLVAKTFHEVSLKSKAIQQWRLFVFDNWRERLATEYGYRSVARRCLREWKMNALLVRKSSNVY